MGVSHVELRHCQSVLWAPDTPESGPAEKTWVMGVIMQNTNCGLTWMESGSARQSPELWQHWQLPVGTTSGFACLSPAAAAAAQGYLRPNRCLLLQLRHALVPDWTLLVPSCSSHGINPVHLVL